uniref:Uncharacterized protein n=3 Tax=Lygus hesperus TaxID=30085 RepID=A0A0A9YDH0_LYGHE
MNMTNEVRNYDLFLKQAAYTMNTTPTKALQGRTPYQCIFGKNHNYKDGLRNNEDKDDQERINELHNTWDQLPRIHREEFLKRKKQFDKNRPDAEFQEGDLILIETKYLEPNVNKRTEKYTGPFQLKKQTGRYNFLVEIPFRNGVRDRNFHVSQFRRFHKRQQIPEDNVPKQRGN